MATFDVLLPVKNGIDYLAQAVDSIIAQTYTDWRLLILDHGSSDGSYEVAQQYAAIDSRVVVHSLPEAVGLSGLLNAGLDMCDCRYVIRQDADDISMPNRMEVMANVFDTDPDLVLAGSLGEVIDFQNNVIGSIDMPLGPYAMKMSALFRTPIAHPTVVMRYSSIKKINARYGVDFIRAIPAEQRMEVPGLAEDYFLFGQLALVAKCLNLGQNLIKYRWHANNVGSTKHEEQMHMALTISRYLVKTMSIVHGQEYFDPAPFCNHGEKLFAINQQDDHTEAYKKLYAMLSVLAPQNRDMHKELSFRKSLSSRQRFVMAVRYVQHVLRYGFLPSDWRSIKSWLINPIKKQLIFHVNLQALNSPSMVITESR